MLLPHGLLTSHEPEAVVNLHTTAPRSVNSLLPHALLPPLELHVAARSECGPVRGNNEDRYLVVRFDRNTQALATNIDESQLRFLPTQSAWALAVADGMGGHAAGEVASTLALSLALRFSQQGSRWFVSIGEPEAKVITARLEAIVQSVDEAILNQAADSPRQSGMGTTLTVLTAVGDCGFVCHVGDSRAYLLRQGHLVRITRDHTVAQDLVDAGLLAPEQMAAHHGSQVLTQAMPGRDGYDLISSVRCQQAERGGTTPAIALTAFARPEDRIRVLAAGFQMHLAKPADPAELVVSVASLAGRVDPSHR